MTATFSGKISSAESNRSLRAREHHRTREWLGGSSGGRLDPEQVAQDRVLSGSERLQGWRHHNLSRQPASAFSHPHSEDSAPYVEFSGISRVSVSARCLLFFHWTPPDRVWSWLLYFPPQVFTHMGEIPPSPLFSRLNSHGSNLAMS